MADKIALLLEAERRGILPPEKVALLAEARKRGLVPGGQKAPADFSGVTAATDTTANSFMDRAINGGRQFIDAHQPYTGAMGNHAMNPQHRSAQAVSHGVPAPQDALDEESSG